MDAKALICLVIVAVGSVLVYNKFNVPPDAKPNKPSATDATSRTHPASSHPKPRSSGTAPGPATGTAPRSASASTSSRVQQLAKAIESGSIRQRLGAVNQLATLKTPEAFAVLAAHARHPEDRVARRVLRSIGEHGGSEAVALLLDTATDKRASIREASWYALAECEFWLVDAAPLLRALQNDPDPEVRAMAAYAAGKLLMWEAMPTLVRYLRQPDVSLRTHAYNSITTMCGVDFGYKPREGGQADRIASVESRWKDYGPYFKKFKQRQMKSRQAGD